MARRKSAFAAVALVALASASVVGCREIVGVPGASSLSSIERPPPICECGPLEQQPGGDVVTACLEAYASLPDFGEGDASAPFGSKEAFLASDCAVCRQDDPAGLRDCFGQLLESATPGASPPVGSDGSACEDQGDCGSWACCAEGGAGSCCVSCGGCSTHVLEKGAVPLCAEDASVFAALGDCLCDLLAERDPAVGCIDECDRVTSVCRPDSAECVDCLTNLAALGDGFCEEQVAACRSSASERPVGSGG